MTKLPSTHLTLLLLLLLLSVSVNSQFSVTDRATLLNLKQQWGNPPSLQNWNSTSSPCDWPEIKCTVTGAVTIINLTDKNISTPVPHQICNLKNLSVLSLSNNNIPGNFPTFLYNCSNLVALDLSQNYFTGQIPQNIHLLSSVKYLDLSGNNFSGQIPTTIGMLSNLSTLFLHRNLLTGTLPPQIGNLSNLEVLGLAYCDFSSSEIPVEFGNLKKLRFLWMTENGLIGEIPASFESLVSLEHLDLSANGLRGEIPRGLLLLRNLTRLYLHQNNLSGSIPMRIESVKLAEIDLSMNNLTGLIPEDVSKLENLGILNLFYNQLSGSIPSGIGLIRSLRIFKAFNNRLSGELPSEFGLHSRLEGLEVSNNRLSGRLPENLCAGGTLFGLVAFSNNFSGEIPESIGNCDSLRTVMLYENNFFGEVPEGLFMSLNLSTLMLSDNSFSGVLPSRLSRNLSRLEISNNRFFGGIPMGVSSWTSLVVFKASNNLFSGEIPLELTALPRINTLFLDGNSISGKLPSQIRAWRLLTMLNLARNRLTGFIPPIIGSLPNLLDLDLSANQLSGQIPPELGHTKINTLNLSLNQLTGKIPQEFENLAFEESFLNNPKLCADLHSLHLQNCYTETPHSHKLSPKILTVILFLAGALFLFVVFMTLCLVRDYQRKKHRRDIATWKLTSFQRLDFTEANILSSLTDTNMIGSGGSGKVYQIAAGRSGDYVAVKRIWSNRKLDSILEKEFLAEVEILGSIRHSNIVKLLCCISSEGSKLLVYEYMENQSLDQWLHGRKKKMARGVVNGGGGRDDVVLDWPMRMEIAIGAAQGLCYMHHGCSPAIIHRDVKSSNILLDSKFKAKIADFGLAKILAKDGHGEPNTLSVVAGSFGYIAPEYAYTTKVNEKIDVYSFGVVLLELVTGREPNDGDGDENICLAEWAWKHYEEGKSVIDAIDEEIKQQYYLKEIITVFKLGLICTNTLPANRPSMKEVLQLLLRCSPFKGFDGKKVGPEYDVAPLLQTESYLSSYKGRTKVADEDGSLTCIV